MALNINTKYDGKLTGAFKNDFSPEHVRKSKNWDFDWILLSKVEECMSLKFTETYVSCR